VHNAHRPLTSFMQIWKAREVGMA